MLLFQRPFIGTVVVALLVSGCVAVPGDINKNRDGVRQAPTYVELEPFDSAEQFAGYLSRQAAAAASVPSGGGAVFYEAASSESTTRSASSGESITNNQEAGVDEGDIVKARGNHLVVLRQGRIFTVELGPDGRNRVVDSIDAFAPGTPITSDYGHWYDEMLVFDRSVVVVGYSYTAGATEIGLFNLSDTGRLAHRDTYYLRSNDYYSSRNYASRLIGSTLVFYMPYGLYTRGWNNDSVEPVATLPALRRSDRDNWDEIITETRVYRPVQPSYWPTMHTVVTCDLADPAFSCEASAVIGPYSRSFYVSADAVYLWVTGSTRLRWDPAPDTQRPEAYVYRFPLDGSRAGVLRAAGAPVDQFSFKEANGALNVVVRAQGGDAMWRPEVSDGDVALYQVALTEFGRRPAAAGRFTDLPTPGGDRYSAFQNRFVGDHLLYGVGSGWSDPDDATTSHQVVVHPYVHGGTTSAVRLGHSVERIEVMGDAAVVVGSDGENLTFTSVGLSRDAAPAVEHWFVQADAQQGETRSHGFFFRADPSDPSSGVLGLPVRDGGRAGWEHLVHGSAGVLFLNVNRHQLTRLGMLESNRSEAPVDDQCKVSCTDWYGNARPIFYQGRTFALLGYELVEGTVAEALTERSRLDFFRLP